MKKLICFLFATLVVFGCKDTSTNNSNNDIKMGGVIWPLKYNNTWGYKYTPPENGDSDTLVIKYKIIDKDTFYVINSGDKIQKPGDTLGMNLWGVGRWMQNSSNGMYIMNEYDKKIKLLLKYPCQINDTYSCDFLTIRVENVDSLISTSVGSFNAVVYYIQNANNQTKSWNRVYMVPNIGLVKSEYSNNSGVYQGKSELINYKLN